MRPQIVAPTNNLPLYTFVWQS